MTIANGFDLILLAILLLVAMRYAGKGFAAALVQFAGNLASLLGASIFSQNIAPVLFTNFFENNFTTTPASRPIAKPSSLFTLPRMGMRLKLVSTATTKPTITLHSAKATKNTTMAMMGVSSGAMT